MADFIILLILAAVIFLIIRALLKQRTKGGCGSCGDGGGCGCGCSGCHKNNRDNDC